MKNDKDERNGFEWACENEHWEVIRWLVMDYGIEKSPSIEKMIQDHPNVQDLFRVREEMQTIQASLIEWNNDHTDQHQKKRAKKAKKL